MVYLHSNSIPKTVSKRNNAPAVGAVLLEAGTKKTQEQSSSRLLLLSEYTTKDLASPYAYYLSHSESGSRGNCEHKMSCLGLPPSRKGSSD